MSTELLRAIYVSAATRHLREEELNFLLDCCRRNNSAGDITGVLAYHEGSFIQVLEGPEGSVKALLATIALDARNTGMSIFDQSRTDKRVFGDWSMGWLQSSDLTRAGYDPDVLFLRSTPDTIVNALFEAFRRIGQVPRQRGHDG